ncbi:MAG: TolC family protein [Opitutales bacterium]
MRNILKILPVAFLATAACANTVLAEGEAPELVSDPVARTTAGSAARPASLDSAPSTPASIPADATVDDLVHYAVENNPSLRAAFERWKAAVERAPQARTLPDPELSYSNFVVRSTDRQGPMGRQRVAISQMFPWFGTLDARGSRAEQQAHAVAHRLEAATNRTVASLRAQYAEYYYVETAGAIFEQHRQLLEKLHEAIKGQYASGLAGRADVLRIEMELARVDDTSRSLRDQKGPVRAKLNAMLGRPATAALPAAQAWDYRLMEETELRALSGRLQAHPELRAREREILAAEEALRLSRLRSRPDFMAGVEYLERRDASDEAMLMVGISLPIWRESYAAGRREARAMERESSAAREALVLDLAARFEESSYTLRDAQRKLRLYDESLLPRAEESFEIIDAAYGEGEAAFLDLVDAQRELLKLRENRARALADQAQSLAQLNELAGRGIGAQQKTHHEND